MSQRSAHSPRVLTAVSDDKALNVLHALVAADMNRVNAIILKRMESPVALIPELAGHVIASGGKRLRPLLTLATAKLLGYGGTRQCELAACVEFIHTATLLHDDVVDQSMMRRGVSAANAVWGNKAPVLVGDFLFSRAFELMVEDGSLKVLKILSRASSVIAEGEVMQLLTAHNTDTGEDAYLRVVDAKTAELFAAACQVSAALAERGSADEEALRTFGRNLGIAFQLVDDALDYSSRDAVLGKNVGDDFREGKITLPVILAFQRGNAEERTFWKRTLEEGQQTDHDLARALALLVRHRALDDTVGRARHYADIARDALGRFPASDVRSALLDIAQFSVQRVY